jgi:hypothetical protein
MRLQLNLESENAYARFGRLPRAIVKIGQTFRGQSLTTFLFWFVESAIAVWMTKVTPTNLFAYEPHVIVLL